MDAVRLAIVLVGVLLLVSSVHVAGAAEASAQPPMFHRAVMGATGGRAKPLSSDYYPAETQTLCFKDSVINNCAVFGCSTDANANGTRDCWNEVYAESQLTCQQDHHENYDGYNSYGSFPGGAGHTAITNVASCSWEFNQFTSFQTNANWKILLPDGVTEKLGTVKGVCTINHGAEHCGEGFKDGPLWGGSVLTIDAGYYKTNAWWTTARKTNIAADGLLPWDTTTGGVTTTTNYPSCCVLEAVGAIDLSAAGEACNGLDFATARRANNRQTAAGAAGRRLQEEGVGTANYDHTGPFYQGDATVIWGPFEAINMATGEKWEKSGVMQWVPWVETVTQTTTGTPSADAFYVEPGTYRFEFKKGSEYNRY